MRKYGGLERVNEKVKMDEKDNGERQKRLKECMKKEEEKNIVANMNRPTGEGQGLSLCN